MPNAIVSVYDKTDIEKAGKILNELGVNIYATSGTYNYLLSKGINVRHIEDICGNPQGFERYFSSLSFNTLVGTLAEQHSTANDIFIEKIDIVIYNFVPSWELIHSSNDFNIQNVDLGGPTIIRAAAINYKNTLPIVSPSQYDILEHYNSIDIQQRKEYAREAFAYCSMYDTQLVNLLNTLL